MARPHRAVEKQGLLGRTEPSLKRGGRTMGEYSEVFVALDVAKKKHAVAIAEGGRTGEVRFLGEVENNPPPIERTIKRLAERYDRPPVCFEAGPTGYGLYRQIQALGRDCMMIAPALIPKRSGERVDAAIHASPALFASVSHKFHHIISSCVRQCSRARDKPPDHSPGAAMTKNRKIGAAKRSTITIGIIGATLGRPSRPRPPLSRSLPVGQDKPVLEPDRRARCKAG